MYDIFIPFAKILASVLLISLLWSTPTHARFFDVADDHPYGEAIDFLTREGIVTGYENRSYQPDRNINRAEFIKIVIAMVFPDAYITSCPDDAVSDYSFTDVPRGSWYEPHLCSAFMNAIVSGYPDGTFRPEEGVNFVESAKMLSLAFGLTGIDLPNLGEQNIYWYTPYVEYLGASHAIPPSIRTLDQPINRGEMAEMIYRLQNATPSQLPPLRLSKSVESVTYPVDWKPYTNYKYGFSFLYPNVWPDPKVVPKGHYDGRNPYYASEWTVFFGPQTSVQCLGLQECPQRDMWIDGYRTEDSAVILEHIEQDDYFMTVESEDIINKTPSIILLEEVQDCIDKRSFHFGKEWIYSISIRCAGEDQQLYQFFEELVQTFTEVIPKPPEHIGQ